MRMNKLLADERVMIENVYRITVEVTGMEGSQLPEDCGGAFVNVYVSATNIKSAIDSAEDFLLRDLYRPIQTTSANQLEDYAFEGEYYEEGDPTNEDLMALKNSGGVWYAAFHTYPPESDEIH